MLDSWCCPRCHSRLPKTQNRRLLATTNNPPNRRNELRIARTSTQHSSLVAARSCGQIMLLVGIITRPRELVVAEDLSRAGLD
jgi:hypothetical protein